MRLDDLQAASLAVLAIYLALFFAMTAAAARAAGRRVCLFGAARGRDRLAAVLFCGGFALAVLGPLLHRLDLLDLSGLPALPGI